MREGQLVVRGALGAEVTVEQGQEAARVALLNALAAAKAALGSLESVVRVARLVVYVNAAPGFTQHPQVANGASDLLIRLFGEAGRHARSAVGVGSLPLSAPVEVELTLEVR
jgi:enamine deaminase RidA (YjgF/YER057c/UK114 family)